MVKDFFFSLFFQIQHGKVFDSELPPVLFIYFFLLIIVMGRGFLVWFGFLLLVGWLLFETNVPLTGLEFIESLPGFALQVLALSMSAIYPGVVVSDICLWNIGENVGLK